MLRFSQANGFWITSKRVSALTSTVRMLLFPSKNQLRAFFMIEKRYFHDMTSVAWRSIADKTTEIIKKHGLRDQFLLLALVLGLLSGIQGFTWGRYDCLNLDKMAFQSLFDKSRLPFQPARYFKPHSTPI
jgi:hypothetical protein